MSADRDARDHIAYSTAARRYNDLIAALEQRGRELGLDAERRAEVYRAADNAVRLHGMHPDQYPFGDPEAAFDLYGW